ncbi:DNA polymerase III, delta' subunit [Nitrospira japonica]|uniref:DNA polymerase III subunit delta' n=1 Tax=Nitrospira japonica TaxID=1325564 RepID=A0A1W1IBH2_9BACT|nr:DNA polymerase III subunit delta' [Nitrospira japonica]SLM50261.1 DNA polymerase III, delta' subunit [Nitrospira japonica]
MPFDEVIGHEATIAALQTAASGGRLAHAYLFHGDVAIGKRLTASRFAQALNCERMETAKPPDACGLCRSCLQIEARTYPDFFVIEPDRELAVPQIKIEEIRNLEQQMVYRPLVGERKICLIDDADRMTIGASNALLKTLEEPPDHSLFLLVSSRPHALPATIRSRCQQLRFGVPSWTRVEAALIRDREKNPADARLLAVFSEGRIGQAFSADAGQLRTRQREILELVNQQTLQSSALLLTAAESLHKSERAQDTLTWLARWIRDVVFVRVGGDPDQLLFAEHIRALEACARQADTDSLLQLLQDIEQTEQQSGRHVNLQIALENILLRLRDAIFPQTPVPSS